MTMSQPTPKPMPVTASSGPVIPSPINIFTNEANNRGARLGSMSVNPGKPAGAK